ncbi:MAG: 5'/3'-nucleotidase SurE [Anaerolineae bacterium]|jgi:5'-nucleotidase|nr:5'/3'-nucleotidase SurE [Anaerolineae bacterium]
MSRKHILVTNDDGVTSPGLFALVKAMQEIADVSVVAPDTNWSACGHVKTMHRPIMVRETVLEDGSPALMTDGAPSDCVALALMGLITQPVDLVVSGINPHANLGDDVTYSGTVSAAMEAVINHVPGIACSMQSPMDGVEPDYHAAAQYCKQVAQKVLVEGLPTDVVLSVNVPYQPSVKVKGFKVTRQGKRVYHDELLQYEGPKGKRMVWIGGSAPTAENILDSDFNGMMEGYVAVTPLQLNMTADHFIPKLREWDF